MNQLYSLRLQKTVELSDASFGEVFFTPKHKVQCELRSLVIGSPVIWSNHSLTLPSIGLLSCCIFIYVISCAFDAPSTVAYSPRYTLTDTAQQTTNIYNIRDLYIYTNNEAQVGGGLLSHVGGGWLIGW